MIKYEIKSFIMYETELPILEFEDVKYLKSVADNYVYLFYSKNSDSFYFAGIFDSFSGKVIYVNDLSIFYRISDDGDVSKFSDYVKENIEITLAEKIKDELLAGLVSIQNTNISEKVKKTAKKYFMNESEPSFDFLENIKVDLNFNNIITCLKDIDDFAYEESLKILDNNEVSEEYIFYLSVCKEIENLKGRSSLELMFEKEYSQMKRECLSCYKNIRLEFDDTSMNSSDSVEVKSLKEYPPYAIKKVYWGRRLVYNRNAILSESDVEELKKNINYNIDILLDSQNYSSCILNHLNLVDSSLFTNQDFVNVVLTKLKSDRYSVNSSKIYDLIDINLLENISFVRNNKNLLDYYYYFNKVSESFVMKYFDDFKDVMVEVSLTYLPDYFRTNDKLFAEFIKVDNKNLQFLNIKNCKSTIIQDAIDNTPFKYDVSNSNNKDYLIDLSLIKSYKSKMEYLNIYNFKTLESQLRNDKDILERLYLKLNNCWHTNVYYYNYLDEIYFYLGSDIIKDTNFMIKFLKKFRISKAVFDVLPDNLKAIPEIAYNHYYINKEEFLKLSISKQLEIIDYNLDLFAYKNARTSGYNVIPEEILIYLSKDSSRVKEVMDIFKNIPYSQRNDKDLVRKIIKNNSKFYECFSTFQDDEEIANIAVKDFSIIPYLSNNSKYSTCNLWDDKKLMLKSLKHNPDHFEYFQETRKTGEFKLLKDKDFVKKAIKLCTENIFYLRKDNPFINDEDIIKLVLKKESSYFDCFDSKIFKNVDLMIDILKTYYTPNGFKYIETNCDGKTILDKIPKYIKTSKEFLQEFPNYQQ